MSLIRKLAESHIADALQKGEIQLDNETRVVTTNQILKLAVDIVTAKVTLNEEVEEPLLKPTAFPDEFYQTPYTVRVVKLDEDNTLLDDSFNEAYNKPYEMKPIDREKGIEYGGT